MRRLVADDHDVVALTRSIARARAVLGDQAEIVEGDVTISGPWQEQIDGSDAVINLVGEPILPGRWTGKRKELIRRSRIRPTNLIVEAIAGATDKPALLLSGSAVSYYGNRADAKVTENDAPADDFSANLCRDWEEAAEAASEYGVRVVTLRTSFVLGAGGALDQMVRPFKMWIGGPIGSGCQYLPWIHIDDYVDFSASILRDDHFAGPVNMAAGAVTNRDFSAALGRVLGRSSWLRVPEPILKLMIGEGSVLVLEGQRIVPQKIFDAGYTLKFSALEAALADVLSGAGR